MFWGYSSMNPLFRTLIIVITLLITTYIGGCEFDDEETAEGPIAAFVGADPLPGDIDVNSTITVTFDNVPKDIKVETGSAKIRKVIIAGKTVTIPGPFTPGPLPITITWANGVQTLNYTVTSPGIIDDAPSVVVHISPASVKSPALGGQLVLNVNITGGENVAGYELRLSFDPTALRYISSSNADYLPVGAFVVPPLRSPNQVTLAAISLNGGSQGAGTLATVTFEVIAVKPSALILSEVRVTDTEANFLRVSTKNAEVIEAL